MDIVLNDNTKIRRTILTSPSDYKFVEEFEHQLEMLTGMVNEMFVEEKQLLLSPIMIELIAEKAKLVKQYLSKLHNHLCTDNLGEDFKL